MHRSTKVLRMSALVNFINMLLQIVASSIESITAKREVFSGWTCHTLIVVAVHCWRTLAFPLVIPFFGALQVSVAASLDVVATLAFKVLLMSAPPDPPEVFMLLALLFCCISRNLDDVLCEQKFENFANRSQTEVNRIFDEFSERAQSFRSSHPAQLSPRLC